MSSVLENVKNSDSNLTQQNKTVVGAKYSDTDIQNWQVVFKYVGKYPKEATLQNDATNDFLGWDSNKNVKMETNSSPWWTVVRTGTLYTFQVPHAGDVDSAQTLELQDDGKVILKLQSGNPTKAQQWKLLRQ